LQVASFAAWPTLIDLNDLTLRYSTQSLPDILAATQDKRQNPYLAFWHERLGDLASKQADAIIIWIEADQQLIPAFTLASVLKQAQSQARIILMGPFLQPFAEVWERETSWRELVDEIVPGAHPRTTLTYEGKELLAETVTREEIWSLDGLPLERYLAQPPVVALTLDEFETLPGETEQDTKIVEQLYRRMCALQQAKPGLRLHITTPLQRKSLEYLAHLMQRGNLKGCGPTGIWGSFVAFGTHLSSDITQALADVGCCYLHFELKGFLGYRDPDSARNTMTESWRNTREAGMRVLWTVVFGHPLDDPKRFADFVAFLREQRTMADRLVRFKVYRLYRGSRFWRHEKEYGLQIINKDSGVGSLQRHFSFISTVGGDSRELQRAAPAHIAALQCGAGDLPRVPLMLDDCAFPRHSQEAEEGLSRPRESHTSDSTGRMLQLAPTVVLHRFGYPFGELESRWSGFMPSQPLPVHEPVTRGKMVLVYETERGRFLAMKPATLPVLEGCQQAIPEEQLLARFAEKQRPVIRKVVEKFIEEGLIQAK
jgi:hypothetical protein